MSPTFTLSHYIERAMAQAAFELLDDGTYTGRIPPCIGVIAFGKSKLECAEELRSTLEDWILIGLRFGDLFPVIDGVDINIKTEVESLEAV